MNNAIGESRLEDVLFYVMERTIKSYRQFAQRNINSVNGGITVDQWLVLKTLSENPKIPQKEIAEKVFKDYASITRIIDLLVKKGMLKRLPFPEDLRRSTLHLTSLGTKTWQDLMPIILSNRAHALNGLEAQEIITLRNLLEKITSNCTKEIYQKTQSS